MFVKGYCIQGQARDPNLKETSGWALNAQIQPRRTGSFPTPKNNMKTTWIMRVSGIPK